MEKVQGKIGECEGKKQVVGTGLWQLLNEGMLSFHAKNQALQL